jgi:hypothetical protein
VAGVARRSRILKIVPRQTGSSDPARDALYDALPPGKRVSRTGRVYYEYRRNRSDLHQSERPRWADRRLSRRGEDRQARRLRRFFLDLSERLWSEAWRQDPLGDSYLKAKALNYRRLAQGLPSHMVEEAKTILKLTGNPGDWRYWAPYITPRDRRRLLQILRKTKTGRRHG